MVNEYIVIGLVGLVILIGFINISMRSTATKIYAIYQCKDPKNPKLLRFTDNKADASIVLEVRGSSRGERKIVEMTVAKALNVLMSGSEIGNFDL